MWRTALNSARTGFAGAIKASGYFSRRLNRHLTGNVVVLTYHRVLPLRDCDSFSTPAIIVTPQTFDHHLRWISSELNPITPSEFGAILRNQLDPPQRACLVTFDDGWHDNLTHALPILERHKVTALLFAATGFIGTSECFWQERLARLLHSAWWAGKSGETLLRLAAVRIAHSADERCARSKIRDAIERQKSRAPSEINSLIRQIEDRLKGIGIPLPVNFGDDRFLSWTDLQQLASSGRFSIGSHAISHIPLPALQVNAVQSELLRSRACLQTNLRQNVDWFAYPNGEYNATVSALVKAAGYHGAFTTESGCVLPGRDTYSLRRINMSEGSSQTLGRFLSRIAGAL